MNRNIEEIVKVVESCGYNFVETYKDKNGIRTIIYDIHGYKYDVGFYNLKNGNPPYVVCPSNPYSIDNIKIWIKNNSKSFELCDNNVYKHAHEKLKLHCTVCNDYFYITWNNLYNGHGCGVCDGVQVGEFHSLKHVRPDLAIEFDSTKNKVLPDNILAGTNVIYWWICSLCNFNWRASVDERNRGSTGCPNCAGNILKSHETFVNDVFNLYGDEYSVLSEYKGSLSKILMKHNICGNSWNIIPASFLSGIGCPNCASSKGENRISKWLFENNIVFEKEEKFSDCKNIRPLPFDFYIADYNLCIEYQGEQHYTENKFFGGKKGFTQRKINDKIKEDYCYNNGINLLIIPYWEFDSIEKILKDTFLELERST